MTDQEIAPTPQPTPPIVVVRAAPVMKYVNYKCANPRCGETDRGKFFENEPIPSVIQCWSCHAGQGLSIEQMLHTMTGMFIQEPVAEPAEPLPA